MVHVEVETEVAAEVRATMNVQHEEIIAAAEARGDVEECSSTCIAAPSVQRLRSDVWHKLRSVGEVCFASETTAREARAGHAAACR